MIIATDSGHWGKCSERVFLFDLHFGPRRWVQLCYPHFTEETTEAHGIKSLGKYPELHRHRCVYKGPGNPRPSLTVQPSHLAGAHPESTGSCRLQEKLHRRKYATMHILTGGHLHRRACQIPGTHSWRHSDSEAAQASRGSSSALVNACDKALKFKSQLCSVIAAWPWMNYLYSQCLRFPTCKWV